MHKILFFSLLVTTLPIITQPNEHTSLMQYSTKNESCVYFEQKNTRTYSTPKILGATALFGANTLITVATAGFTTYEFMQPISKSHLFGILSLFGCVISASYMPLTNNLLMASCKGQTKTHVDSSINNHEEEV